MLIWMTYEIIFDKSVLKFLRRVSSDEFDRIEKKFFEVRKDPFRFLEHLEGQKLHKLRIGSYRALLDVDNSRRIIFVRVFDKRRRIYKKQM